MIDDMLQLYWDSTCKKQQTELLYYMVENNIITNDKAIQYTYHTKKPISLNE